MEDISSLYAFLKVVERSSFSGAASELNCSTSSVSKKIIQLEYAVGAKLLNRSTHGLANLTEAGAVYYDKVRHIISDLENAKESVRDIGHGIHGKLKVHVTPGTGLRIAVPAILEFMATYPSIFVEISVRPESFDIMSNGFDVSIRSNTLLEPDTNYATVEARELVKAQYVICATQSYFTKHGVPSYPSDLAEHNCLVSIRQPSPQRWWFWEGEKKFHVEVKGSLVADSWPVVLEAAKAGIGIARMLCVNTQSPLKDGLQPIFTNETVSDRSIWALVPRMIALPRKSEVFLKFLEGHFQRPE